MSREKRGAAGGRALKKDSKEILNNNVKAIRKALEKLKNEGLPFGKKEVAEKAGVSPSTVYRSPHKEIIEEYIETHRMELATNSKVGFSVLLNENKMLKEELKEFKEKYKRLKSEIEYSKKLYE